MHSYMSSWQSSGCFWTPTNFLSLFPPKREFMSPSLESGLSSDSYVITWLWQKWCCMISEASSEETMQVLPCSPEYLHRSPGLAWKKFSYHGDPRWIQPTVPRLPPAEAPGSQTTKEPGHSEPLVFAWIPDPQDLQREKLIATCNSIDIQKTKIMASGPITSWEIDGETVETVSDFIFGAPKSLWMVTAAMKLKDAYSLEGKLWPT